MLANKHGTPLNDGFSGAPAQGASSIQNPTLLNGYAKRPGWRVAGVDYYVGIDRTTYPTNANLKVVSQANLDAQFGSGVVNFGTFNGRANTVQVNTSNVTFDGWDMTAGGGITLYYAGGTNLIVSNCNFQSDAFPSSTGVLQATNNVSGLTVKNCVMDGNGLAAAFPSSSLIYSFATGNITIQYNWFKNGPFNNLTIGTAASPAGPISLDYRFNYIELMAAGVGQHMNYSNYGTNNVTITANVQFNTSTQVVRPWGSGLGYTFWSSATGTLLLPTCAYNTLIAGTTSPTAAARQNSHAYNLNDVITVGGSQIAYYTCTTAGTSAGSPPAGYATTGQDATITDGGAVFTGQALSVSQMIDGGSEVSGSNYTPKLSDVAWCHDNYMDISGARGGFYQSSDGNPPFGMAGWTVANNIDMTNGKVINRDNTET